MTIGVMIFALCLLTSVRESVGTLNNVSYYSQKLDHFSIESNGSTRLFQQRYYIDDHLWSGAAKRGPIIAFLGGQHSMDAVVGNVGLLNEAASQFDALIVYIEHRFYGESVPLKSIDLAMSDRDVRGYLTTEQALTDFAEIILHLKNGLSAQKSPVIVVGGSYAGAWFRLRFPHIAVGALASSAPLLLLNNNNDDDGESFCSIVSQDYKDVDYDCYDKIRSSWRYLKQMSLQPDGLVSLGRLFNTCKPLMSFFELQTSLGDLLSELAQYDDRSSYYTTLACKIISGSNTTIEGMANLVSTLGNHMCYDVGNNVRNPFYEEPDAIPAWRWQQCTEMLMPISCNVQTMLPSQPFNLAQFQQFCQSLYGTQPQPELSVLFYGGQDVISTFKHQTSNIVFSNGLRDPNSIGGILEDLSDTVIAIVTDEGTHVLDLILAKDDDPGWLKDQRNEELHAFKLWIKEAHRSHGTRTIQTQNHLISFVIFTLCFLLHL